MHVACCMLQVGEEKRREKINFKTARLQAADGKIRDADCTLRVIFSPFSPLASHVGPDSSKMGPPFGTSKSEIRDAMDDTGKWMDVVLLTLRR